MSRTCLLAALAFVLVSAGASAQTPSPERLNSPANDEAAFDWLGFVSSLEDAGPRGVDALKQKIIEPDVCGTMPTRSNDLCAIAVYRLFRTVEGEAQEIVITPIKSVLVKDWTSTATAVSHPPRSVFLSARYVLTATGGYLDEAPMDSLLKDKPARDVTRGRAVGHYYFTGIVGNRENIKKELGLPAELFFLSSYQPRKAQQELKQAARD